MTFEEQIAIEHKNRTKNEQWERHCKNVNGETIYCDYRLFCKCNGIESTEENFNKWIKNREINFWQLKYLREKYFGYKYTYKNGEWCIKICNKE